MTSNVLPLFWHLASSSKDTRISASADLISSLEGFQQNFAPANPSRSAPEDDEEDDGVEDDDGDESGVEVDASDDGRDARTDGEVLKLDRAMSASNAEDVVYSLRRLVRGLGSSRESSRLGYAVALTELLSRIPSITAPQVLSLLIRNSQYSRSMKGSDERDMLFARLFGLTAIIQSGALFSASARPVDFDNVVDHLLMLGQYKAWLRESAWWAVVGVTERLLDSQVAWKDEAIERLLETVFADKVWSQEKVGLALALERRRPDLDWKTLYAPTFKHTPLLANANLVTLAKVLKETDSDDEEVGSTSSTGSWKPQLHFVWSIIIDTYFPSSSSSVPQGFAPFQEFFRVVVDESLFANSSSSERKYWGFSIFSLALPHVTASLMPQIFTPNFMRCWMNNLSSPDRYLHKAALGIAKAVQDVVKQNPKVGFTLLSTLVGKHGRQDFDKVTKTKTVESIMGGMDVEGAKEYVTYLQGLVLASDEKTRTDMSGLEERRSWALDQLLALCRNGSVPRDDSWIASVLDFLLVHGFFVLRKADKKSPMTVLHLAPRPPLSEVSAATSRSRFFSALVEMTTASASATRQQGCDIAGKLWLERSLETMLALEKDGKHVELMLDADEEIRETRKGALETLKQVRNKTKGDQADLARGIEILLTFIILQTYDESEDALDWLEQVDGASQHIFGLAGKQAEDTEPIDGLLDVLIALLDKGSSDLRSLANLVVGMIAGSFTSSSIQHLVAQLESTLGQTAEAEQIVTDDEEGQSKGDDNEEAEDEDDEDDEMSSAEEDSDDDGSTPVDPAFRARVAEALQVSGMALDGDNAADDDDDEDEESDEEVWDDEQMMKVDEQLAEVFRQQAGNKKTDMKHMQIEALHFKNRILDFFDSIARRHIDNPVSIDLVLPLLRLIRSAGISETDLSNKASGILRARFIKAKDVPTSVPAEHARQVLEEIHELARRSASTEFSHLCSGTSLFIVRALDNDNSTAIDAYSKTLKEFMTRKHSSIQPAFILDLIKRYPTRAWSLRNDLLEYTADVSTSEGINAYHQTQAFNMLSAFASQLNLIAKSVPLSEITTFVKTASSSVYGILQAASTPEGAKWKADRLKDVVRFALQLARTSKSVLGASVAEAWDLERLSGVEGAMKRGRTAEMKGVIGLVGQLKSVLSGGGGGSEKKKAKAAGLDKTKVKASDKAETEKLVNGEKDGDGDVDMTPVKVNGDQGKEKKIKKRKSVDGVKVKSKDGEKRKKVKSD
ncbi:DNA polymerase phi-domain-containing protein [Naematelia encephala]|uniref:DNA polymerase phi-domain-containing protein n=1 Tax=Naematelia encephala TaxID=71784 RepID=A0A1Y2AR01_9TREE|nr:DNA polymerase phi-domain-containing protein [Naematelia encephala]